MSRSLPTLSRAERLVAGLLQRFPELPVLAGSGWPVLYWQIRDRLRAFAAMRDSARRDVAARELARVVGDAISVGGESWLEAAGSGAAYPFEHEGDSGSLDDQLHGFLKPEAVRCELRLQHPRKVALGTIVQLELSFLEAEDDLAAGHRARLDKSLPVRVKARGLGLEVKEGWRDVMLSPDSLPIAVRIPFTGVRLGTATLLIDVWQGKELLSGLRAQLEVVPSLGGEIPGVSRGFTVVGGVAPPEADLCLQVATDGRELLYTMDFENERALPTLGRITLRGDLHEFWGHLRQKLEQVRKQPFSEEELARIGDLLFSRFWPPELRDSLWEVIDRGIVSMSIFSDVPWIPWDLMRPRDRRGRRRGFLSECCNVAYWHQPNGGNRPRPALELSRLGLVVPDDHGLQAVAVEDQWIRRLAAERRLKLATVEPADRRRTLAALASSSSPQVNLWHFAGHGNVSSSGPDQAPIWLRNNSTIRPDDLVGDLEVSLRQSRPMVFLNACRVGEGGHGVTGLGGWAYRLVGDCGAGAVLAPRWAVRDSPALAFAQAFYELVPHDRGDPSVVTIAQAVRLAREQARESDRTDSSWLAYALFAHPNARIHTGASADESRGELR